MVTFTELCFELLRIAVTSRKVILVLKIEGGHPVLRNRASEEGYRMLREVHHATKRAERKNKELGRLKRSRALFRKYIETMSWFGGLRSFNKGERVRGMSPQLLCILKLNLSHAQRLISGVEILPMRNKET